MFQQRAIVTARKTTDNVAELRRIYGGEAVISQVSGFNLIHLDEPGDKKVLQRELEFDPEDYFEDDCPLCRMMREEGFDVIFMGDMNESRV